MEKYKHFCRVCCDPLDRKYALLTVSGQLTTVGQVVVRVSELSVKHLKPSTSCTGVCLAITMLQYYICLGIVLTVILVLGLGLGFGIILYFVIGT